MLASIARYTPERPAPSLFKHRKFNSTTMIDVEKRSAYERIQKVYARGNSDERLMTIRVSVTLKTIFDTEDHPNP